MRRYLISAFLLLLGLGTYGQNVQMTGGIDLNSDGQIVDARIEVRSAAPSDADTGDLYYDSDDNYLYMYNGSAWVRLFNMVTGSTHISLAGQVSASAGIFSATLSAPKITASGTDSTGGVFVGNDGQIYDGGTDTLRTPDSFTVDGTLSAGTLNAGTLNWSGLMSIPNDALITGTTQTTISAASVNDVFIYDPREDSDGGEWTHDKHTSWYRELGPFPVPAAIVGTDSVVNVYDVSTGLLWKSYTEAGTGLSSFGVIGKPATGTRTVFAKDGYIVVGNAVGSDGMDIIDFRNDTAYLLITSGTHKYNGDLATTGAGFSLHSSLPNVVSNIINDVHAQVVNNKLYFAAATNGGVSIVNWTDQTVVDITNTFSSGSTNFCRNVYLTSAGWIYWTADATTSQRALHKMLLPTSDTSSNYQTGAIPITYFIHSSSAYWGGTGTQIWINNSISSHIYDLNIIENGGIHGDNRLLLGTNVGQVIIDEKQGDETNGSVQYITNSYNTGPMIGDIRLTMDFDGASGTTYSDHSIKAATGIANVSTSIAVDMSVSGVVGKAGDFNGSTNYVSIYDSDNYSFTSGAFSISGWIYPDTVSGVDGITAKYDTSNREFNLYLNAGKLTFQVYDESANASIGRLYNTALTVSQWYHFTAIYTGGTTSASIDLYLNGVAVDDTDANSGSFVAIENLGEELRIGAYSSSGSIISFFDGKIDQLTITAEALTVSQIKYMYEQGLASLNNHTAPNGLSNADALQTLAQGTDSQVNSIALTDDNDLLIGTNTAGLLQFDPNGAGVTRVWNVNNAVLSASDITAVAAYGIPRSATAEAPGGLAIAVDTTTDYVLMERNQVSLIEALHESMKQSNQFNEIATDRIFARGGTVAIYVSQSGQLWLGGEVPDSTTTTYLLKGKAGTGGLGFDFYNINSSKFAGAGKSFIVEEATPALTTRASRIKSVKLTRYTRNDWPEPVESKYIFSATEQVPDVTETVYVAEEVAGEIQVTTQTIILDARAQLERDHAKWYQHHVNKPQEFGVVKEDLPPEYQDGDSVKFSLMFFEALAEIKEMEERDRAQEAAISDIKMRLSEIEKNKVPDHELRIKGLEGK